jgi:hypothetical protein
MPSKLNPDSATCPTRRARRSPDGDAVTSAVVEVDAVDRRDLLNVQMRRRVAEIPGVGDRALNGGDVA